MKENKKNNNKIKYIVIAVIIFLQLSVVVYWTSLKTNYYIDELYSFGYASSFTGVGDTSQYITYSDKWTYDTWISNGELKEFLLISEEESITRQPVLTIIKEMLFDWNYVGILNFVNYLAGTEDVGKWSGVILNMILFVCTQLIMVSLMRKLRMSDWMICCGLAIYGFCSLIMGITTYIRFYSLTIFLLWCTIWLFYKLWDEERIKHIVVCELFSYVTILMCINNSELTIVVCGMIVALYMLRLFVSKSWKKLLLFTPEAIALLSFLAFGTSYLDMLLSPEDFTSTGGAIGWTTNNVVNASLESFLRYLSWGYNVVAEKVFGHQLVMLLFLVLFFVAFWAVTKEKKKYTISWWQIVSFVFTIGITRMAYINGHNRTISLILLMAMVIWAVIIPLYRSSKRYTTSSDTWFIIAMGMTALVYTVFCALAFLDEPRYFSFAIVILFLCIWYVLDKALQKSERKVKKIGYFLILGLCIVVSVLPFRNRNIDYIYEDEKEIISKIMEYQNLDIILTAPLDPSGVDIRHEAYECIYWMSKESKLYPIELDNYELSIDDSLNEIVLWTHRETDITKVITELEKKGFLIDTLGETHVSRIFLCSR